MSKTPHWLRCDHDTVDHTPYEPRTWDYPGVDEHWICEDCGAWAVEEGEFGPLWQDPRRMG